MKNENLKKISNAVGGITISDTNDYVCASKLLGNVKSGSEYFFSVGKHSAVVRRNGDRYEFLEMQQKRGNGWKELNKESLAWRFGSTEENKDRGGEKYKNKGFLIPFDKLNSNTKFESVLEFINTNRFKKKR